MDHTTPAAPARATRQPKPTNSAAARPAATRDALPGQTPSAPPSPTHAPSSPRSSSFVSALFNPRRPVRDPSKPASTGRLFELTEVLLIQIVALLDLSDATSLSCTCRLFRGLITDDTLWQSLILQKLNAAGHQPPNGIAHLQSQAPPSAEPLMPFTTPAPTPNGFIRHWTVKKSVEHEHGERWAEAVGALLPTTSSQYSDDVLQDSWQRVVGKVPPPYLQNVYYSFATGATCTRPLLKRSDQLQASFLVVLPGLYEVVWNLKFKNAKLGQAGHMRFDTCVTYHHLEGERNAHAEYGNKSTVWNGSQLSSLEGKHGRGTWVGVVVTALKVARMCQAEVAVKGMEDCSGIWVRRVQLRRVVGEAVV
jgi:hypothetical protein